MAKAILDPMFSSISGRVGDLIFRHRADGQTIISRRPQPSRATPTPAELATRANFTMATTYARSAMANPEARAYYAQIAKRNQTPVFAEAVRDYFHPPVIESIDLSGYRGRPRDPIGVVASGGVTIVTVAIRARGNAILEQGAAVLDEDRWNYTGTTKLPRGVAVTIEVTARDRAGHDVCQTAAFTRSATKQ